MNCTVTATHSALLKPREAAIYEAIPVGFTNNWFLWNRSSVHFSSHFNLLPLKLSINKVRMSSLLSRPHLRIMLMLAISMPMRIILDLIFALLYRNYTIIRPPADYAGAAILTVLIFELVMLAKNRYNRIWAWEKNPLRRLMIESGINIPLMAVLITAASIIISLFISRSAFIKLSDQSITTAYYLFALVIFPAFAEFAIFLLNRWRFSLAEMEKYKKENAEYRFETLRTQVNPHFLFNSLNTLSSLMYENRDKAAKFIRDLSDVYRYVLDNRNRETILLADELKFIKSFVFLYQLRFENKLVVTVEIDERDQQKYIAPMTLQMLIENAVKHNIVSQKKPLHIRIYSDNEGYISVSNNLQKKMSGVVSSGIGLQNITSRYAFLHQNPVKIRETETEFVVNIPLI